MQLESQRAQDHTAKIAASTLKQKGQKRVSESKVKNELADMDYESGRSTLRFNGQEGEEGGKKKDKGGSAESKEEKKAAKQDKKAAKKAARAEKKAAKADAKGGEPSAEEAEADPEAATPDVDPAETLAELEAEEEEREAEEEEEAEDSKVAVGSKDVDLNSKEVSDAVDDPGLEADGRKKGKVRKRERKRDKKGGKASKGGKKGGEGGEEMKVDPSTGAGKGMKVIEAANTELPSDFAPSEPISIFDNMPMSPELPNFEESEQQGLLGNWRSETAWHDEFKQGDMDSMIEIDRDKLIGEAMGSGVKEGAISAAVGATTDLLLDKVMKKVPFVGGFMEMARITMDPKGYGEGMAQGTAGNAVKGITNILECLTGEGSAVDFFEGVLQLMQIPMQFISILCAVSSVVAAVCFALSIIPFLTPALAPIAAFMTTFATMFGTVATVLGLFMTIGQSIIMGMRATELKTREADPSELLAIADSLEENTQAVVQSAGTRTGKGGLKRGTDKAGKKASSMNTSRKANNKINKQVKKEGLAGDGAKARRGQLKQQNKQANTRRKQEQKQKKNAEKAAEKAKLTKKQRRDQKISRALGIGGGAMGEGGKLYAGPKGKIGKSASNVKKAGRNVKKSFGKRSSTSKRRAYKDFSKPLDAKVKNAKRFADSSKKTNKNKPKGERVKKKDQPAYKRYKRLKKEARKAKREKREELGIESTLDHNRRLGIDDDTYGQGAMGVGATGWVTQVGYMGSRLSDQLVTEDERDRQEQIAENMDEYNERTEGVSLNDDGEYVGEDGTSYEEDDVYRARGPQATNGFQLFDVSDAYEDVAGLTGESPDGVVFTQTEEEYEAEQERRANDPTEDEVKDDRMAKANEGLGYAGLSVGDYGNMRNGEFDWHGTGAGRADQLEATIRLEAEALEPYPTDVPGVLDATAEAERKYLENQATIDNERVALQEAQVENEENKEENLTLKASGAVLQGFAASNSEALQESNARLTELDGELDEDAEQLKKGDEQAKKMKENPFMQMLVKFLAKLEESPGKAKEKGQSEGGGDPSADPGTNAAIEKGDAAAVDGASKVQSSKGESGNLKTENQNALSRMSNVDSQLTGVQDEATTREEEANEIDQTIKTSAQDLDAFEKANFSDLQQWRADHADAIARGSTWSEAHTTASGQARDNITELFPYVSFQEEI